MNYHAHLLSMLTIVQSKDGQTWMLKWLCRYKEKVILLRLCLVCFRNRQNSLPLALFRYSWWWPWYFILTEGPISYSCKKCQCTKCLLRCFVTVRSKRKNIPLALFLIFTIFYLSYGLSDKQQSHRPLNTWSPNINHLLRAFLEQL